MKIIIIDDNLSRCEAVAERLRGEFGEADICIGDGGSAGRESEDADGEVAAEWDELWRGLVSNLPELSIGLIDQEQRLLLASGAGWEALGLERTIGRRMGEIAGFAPELKAQLSDHCAQALAGRGSQFEAIWNGSSVRMQASPIRYKGRSCCLLLIFGVTGERRAEHQFSLAFQASGCAMAISRAEDLTLVDVNRSWEDLFGYQREEVLGWRIFDKRFCYGASEGESARDLASGDSVFRFRTRSGEAREAKVTVVPLKWRGEDCSLVILFDLTEQRGIERQLQQLTGRMLRLQDEERRRIARELHDGLAQEIFALTIDLAHLEAQLSDSPADLRSLLNESLALGEQALQEVRTISYLLHPPLLEQAGLVSAVRCYLEGFTRRSGIEAEFEVDEGIGRLGIEIETALFRIVQEGLANIARHASSARARVSLRKEEEQVILRIEDFGCGLPSALPRSAENEVLGVGIPGMRQRMRQLGGRLEISSSRRGTVVAAVVPVEGRVAA